MNGRAGGWFPGTQARHQGHIRAGGVDNDVTFAHADPDLNDQIDAAYRDKYHRYGPSIIGGVMNPGARSATIKLVPRSPGSWSKSGGWLVGRRPMQAPNQANRGRALPFGRG
jgi:hypothetical protein